MLLEAQRYMTTKHAALQLQGLPNVYYRQV